ncbi:RE1 [Symbiodinium sp. CCMP2592]|nr:RE1 [Symbiodinium sp. CCMP2592]
MLKESKIMARQASRVIPPTEWSWTEPAESVAGRTATHPPTTVFTSSDEEEQEEKKAKEEPEEVKEEGNTSDWLSEESEAASTDSEDPNGVAALLRKDERRAEAKRHQRAPPEPAEPPRAKEAARLRAAALVGKATRLASGRTGLDKASKSRAGRRQPRGLRPRGRPLLERYGKLKEPVDESKFTSEESRLAKAMYTFLIQYCPAWVWRRHLSNPSFPSDISQWSTALHQWEAELREFERTYKATFSEDEKVSILAHVAPKELQQSIFMHSDALDSYGKIRECIEQQQTRTEINLMMEVCDQWTLEVSKVGAVDTEAATDTGGTGGSSGAKDGTPLKVYGKQYPQVMFGRTSGSVEMTVTDAAESLVSVHSLVAKGHKVVFSPGGCYLETKTGDTVPLELHGKRWYLKVMDKTEGPGPVRGRIAPIGDEVDLGPKEPDRWKREVKDGVEYLIREHNNPRKRLFAPKVKDLPVPLERIESGRLAKMIFEEDGSQKEDRSMWEDKRYAMREMKHSWLGETWFRLKPERFDEPAAEEEQPSHEDEWMRGLDEAYEEEVLGGEEAHEQIVEDEEDADERLAVDEGDDDKKAKAIKAPKEPTAAEVEEHNLHHANFESWCPVCVMGQGKSKQHRRIKEDPKEHIIYSDYMFFSKEGTEVSKEESEKKKAGLVTVLTAICKDSQYPFALVLPSKASVDYASKALTSWIKDLKWDKVVIQFDQESALNKIYEKVKASVGDTITLRRSPRYSSQSLADGEMINGLIAGKVRTWLAEVSEKYKMKIGCDSVLFPWIVRHSAWTLARFHINHSKTTAFRIVNGYDYLGEMMTFGQVAMAKYPKQKDKAAPRWIRGVYVGKNALGDEHLLLTEAGVQTCRTARRLPESSQYSVEVLEKARGVPWNRYLGIATTRVAQEKSEQKAVSVPELEAAETDDFGSGDPKEVLVVPMPAPPQGEKHVKEVSEEPESKRARVEPGEAKQPAGDTAQASGGPVQFSIATPDASMGTGSQDLSLYSPSLPGDMAQDMISCISNHGEWSEASTCLGKEDYEHYKKWVKQNEGCFDSSMVSNIMDYLDTMQMDERELKRARKEELRKLNEVYGAFTPRDGRQLPRDLTVFGHKWVDKVTEGIAKSRLTCQHFKKKQDANERHSSEFPSNFCPTPHATSRKLLEVYSLATRMPRVKADLSSAFLIAKDGGDAKGQPVMMRPPKEWLEDYDEWYAKADPEVQRQLKDTPKESVLWQVDGNLYGRQSAAAQYRDRLEVILTKELPKGVYDFRRGKLDACVFRCRRTGIVLIHHIDDFDVCGPAALLNDLLKVQLPKCGCKLKVGELEWPGEASSSTSEFLGRKKILVEGAVVPLPNEKHINDILRMLGLEEAKPSPVPGKKLNLQDNKPLEGKAKETYASCVGSTTYLSQDRPDIKFACKELAKRIREPRECDMQNLKVLGRYLRGTMHVGHVTKLDEQVDPAAGIPLQGFCDSDWAGDKEDRKSTSGQVIVLGGTVVETSARTQQGTPATSSGEAEVRALTQCAQDLVFVRNLGVEDFGMSIDVPRLFCDSSAAIQVARRLGVGLMRHVDLGHLYIQELVKEERVIVQKIKGTENPSNALTKHLATGAETEEGRGMLGLVTLDKQGLDKHVSKNTMQSVGALTSYKKWQPQQCTRLSTKQFVSAVGDCVHGYNVPTWKALYEPERTQSPLRPWVSRFVQSGRHQGI